MSGTLTDARPSSCRNRLRDEGKPYPRSGCSVCQEGGLRGCIFEKAARVSVSEATVWQPIATAPKDGTPIIGHWIGYKRPCVMWWNLADKAFESWADRHEEPSHWLPLPPAPSARSNEGAAA